MFGESRRALLLLHLQNEVVDPDGHVGRRGIGQVVADRGVLATAERARLEFDESGEPVVHVVFERPASSALQWSTAPHLREPPEEAFVPGGWGSQVPDGLARPGDERVVHHTMSALAGTGLRGRLANEGITAVVLAGVSTHLVVAATAFAASDAGLEVEVIAAACASPTPELQQAGLAICAAVGRVRA